MAKMPFIYHGAWCSEKRMIKSFLQIRAYFDGFESLTKVYYCPECNSYNDEKRPASFDSFEDDDEEDDL